MRTRWLFLPLFAAVAIGALAACGGSTTGSSSPSHGMGNMPGMGSSSSTSATPGSSTSQQPNTVTVTVSDFKVEASQTTFKSGVAYHFEIHNASTSMSHELMAIKPMSGDGMSMEDMDKMALFMVSSAQLAPGATRAFDYTFTQPYSAGQLELACHVGSHYSLGMHMPVTVTQG